MRRFWGFEVYALLREVNSRLQGWCYVCRRGFMPRFCGFIARDKLATTGFGVMFVGGALCRAFVAFGFLGFVLYCAR